MRVSIYKHINLEQMKFYLLVINLFLLSAYSAFSQGVVVGSDEYSDLKSSNQLEGKNLIYDATSFAPGMNDQMTVSNSNKASGCDCYVEPDATYTLALAPNDDGSSSLISVPFDICFYGQTYNSFYINNNGNITFENALSAFSATAFPSADNKIIAPFWGDVDTGDSGAPLGQVVYKITPSAVYINWEDVGYFNAQGDKRNTFQLILTDGVDPVVEGGNVAFCYQDMQWTTGSASSGVNGFGGTPATAGANKGDNLAYFLISRFDHAGVDFDGALGNPDGISWLDDKSFFFDVCSDDNTPPIPEGISLCDTFKVCSYGDTADISINFLSPEIGQITTITYDDGGLTTLEEVSNVPGNTSALVLRIVGDLINAGTYTITVTASDDFVPAGVTTITFVIVIDDSQAGLINPVLTPLIGCDSVVVGVLNGPYDSYLWDDFSTDTISVASQSGSYGVTVSLNGCYIRADADIILAEAPLFYLGDNFTACGSDTTIFLELPDSLNMSNVSWGLSDPGLDSLFSNTLTSGTYTVTAQDTLELCTADTTFTVSLIQGPSIFSDTIACDFGMIVSGTTSFTGGIWTASSPVVQFSDSSAANPSIFIDTLPGIYTVTYTDNSCNISVSSEIDFPGYPWTWLVDTILCDGTSYLLEAPNENQYPTTYTWDNGATGNTVEFTDAGTYVVTLENVCHTTIDEIVIGYKLCDVDAPNVISLAEGSQNPNWYVDASGLKTINIVITNRWGNVVYECSDSAEACIWDGTNRKGNFVEHGVYFYKVNAVTDNGVEIEKHGFIQVVK